MMGPRRRSIAFAIAVSVALLVPLAIFGGSSFAKGFASADEYQYEYGHKVVICHHTHSQKHPFVTITVDRHALKGHMHHDGDTLGPCPGTATTTATTTAGTTTSEDSHGDSHGQGAGNDNGSSHGDHGNGGGGDQGGHGHH